MAPPKRARAAQTWTRFTMRSGLSRGRKQRGDLNVKGRAMALLFCAVALCYALAASQRNQLRRGRRVTTSPTMIRLGLATRVASVSS